MTIAVPGIHIRYVVQLQCLLRGKGTALFFIDAFDT